MNILKEIIREGLRHIQQFGYPTENIADLLQTHPQFQRMARIYSLVQGERAAWDSIESQFRAARFVAAGKPTFKLGQERAAQLVLTDVLGISTSELKLPFEDFAIEVPQGIVPMSTERGEPFFAEYVVVNRFVDRSLGGMRTHITAYGDSQKPYLNLRVTPEEWDRLLDPDEPDDVGNLGAVPLDALDMKTFRAMGRLVAGFLVWYEIAARNSAPFAHRPYKKKAKVRKERELPMMLVESRTAEIDPELVRAAKEFAGNGCRKPRKSWHVRHQFVVRGHWYNQPHGPRGSLRRKAWRRPALKGADSAVLMGRTYGTANLHDNENPRYECNEE